MATGVSGIPNLPEIPSLSKFKGKTVHSAEYGNGEDWEGKKALVIPQNWSVFEIYEYLSTKIFLNTVE